MSDGLIDCQVMDREKEWPYVKKCGGEATHEIIPQYRIYAEGIEYICDKHAHSFGLAYGEHTVKKFDPPENDGESKVIDLGTQMGHPGGHFG